MIEMPRPSDVHPVTFDEAVRACELLGNYFQPWMPRNAERDALTTQRGLRDLLSPIFGTPEGELKRKITQSIRTVKLAKKAKSDATVVSEFAKLRETIQRYAKGE